MDKNIKPNRAFLHLLMGALICLVLLPSCWRGLPHRVINTSMLKTDGVEREGKVYFLLRYRLKKPDKMIYPLLPPYPGKQYIEQLYLYSLSLEDNRLEQLCSLTPPRKGWSYGISNDAKIGTYCEFHNDTLYFAYQSNWTGEEFAYDLYNFAHGQCEGVISDIGRSTMDSLLGLGWSLYEGRLQGYRIDSLTHFLPFEQWNLISPLTFSKLSVSELKTVLVKGIGDRFFIDRIFEYFLETGRPKELRRLADDFLKYYRQLEGYRQRSYVPYLLEGRTKLLLHAMYGGDKVLDGPDEVNQLIYQHKNHEAMAALEELDNVNTANANGTTPLMVAAFVNNEPMAKLLLEKQAHIDANDSMGCTALMYSALGDAPNTLELLLIGGANTDMQCIGNTHIVMLFKSHIRWIYHRYAKRNIE